MVRFCCALRVQLIKRDLLAGSTTLVLVVYNVVGWFANNICTFVNVVSYVIFSLADIQVYVHSC